MIGSNHRDDGFVHRLVVAFAVGAELILGLGRAGDQDFMHAGERLRHVMVVVLVALGMTAIG